MAAAMDAIKQTTLNAELMSGYTGVRVTDVAIPGMSDEDVEAVRRLVSEYCVAVFPGQFLAPEDHLAFIARFGPVTVTPGVDMQTAFENVHMVANRGDPSNPVSGGFHTDTCFVEKPPSYTSLSAVEVPGHGGDTIFCNQYLNFGESALKVAD